MNKDIGISVNARGDVTVVHIRGDVTAVTGGSIEDAYRGMTRDGTRKILLCFDGNCYINSGGIAILIGIVSESRKNNQAIRVAGLTEHFQKIFGMMGLTRYLSIFPSEDAALEGF